MEKSYWLLGISASILLGVLGSTFYKNSTLYRARNSTEVVSEAVHKQVNEESKEQEMTHEILQPSPPKEVDRNEALLEETNFVISTQSVKDYLADFYVGYLEGIKKSDERYIESHLFGENKKEMLATYRSWFIDEKQITGAYLDYGIEELIISNNEEIEVKLHEIVALINEHEDEDYEIVSEIYRIVLTTRVAIERVDGSYKMKERVIEESSVAYQDEEGTWIAY